MFAKLLNSNSATSPPPSKYITEENLCEAIKKCNLNPIGTNSENQQTVEKKTPENICIDSFITLKPYQLDMLFNNQSIVINDHVYNISDNKLICKYNGKTYNLLKRNTKLQLFIDILNLIPDTNTNQPIYLKRYLYIQQAVQSLTNENIETLINNNNIEHNINNYTYKLVQGSGQSYTKLFVKYENKDYDALIGNLDELKNINKQYGGRLYASKPKTKRTRKSRKLKSRSCRRGFTKGCLSTSLR